MTIFPLSLDFVVSPVEEYQAEEEDGLPRCRLVKEWTWFLTAEDLEVRFRFLRASVASHPNQRFSLFPLSLEKYTGETGICVTIQMGRK